MDKVKKTQIQVKILLKDYYNMFSRIETTDELVERFRSLFPMPENYWRHLRRHAIPSSVIEKYELYNWRRVEAHSEKLQPYQVNYALQFLDTIAYVNNIAHVILPNDPKGRIIIFNSKKKLAIIIEPSGKLASVYEVDKIKNWGEWKVQELRKGAKIMEVSIDDELRKIFKSIQDDLRRLIRRFSNR